MRTLPVLLALLACASPPTDVRHPRDSDAEADADADTDTDVDVTPPETTPVDETPLEAPPFLDSAVVAAL
ncbi:MAG: hypothetical protein H0V89_14925, partial [Deltaproteobacteria bacterium]|nr:hypothetical protein [Deltaproteobacteria bacterium]